MNEHGNNDLERKRQIHKNADEKNTIGTRMGREVLLCGAKRKNVDDRCKNLAGHGTDHLGWGRCKFCGGKSTGPRTEEGKARAAQNSTIHRLYAESLNQEEAEIYGELAEQKQLDLEHEIYTLKAKIINYLRRFKGQGRTRRTTVDGKVVVYEVGTVEDRALMRAWDTLYRLVDKQAKMNPEKSEDLVASINAELRAASQQQAQSSWGRIAPPHRLEIKLEAIKEETEHEED